MKTKSLKNDKVNIVTLGCSKNLVDSEVIMTQLRGNGIKTTHESTADNSDVIIINTCGFIDNAKQESIDTILRYADAKGQGQIKKLYVTGCLSQRYREELKTEIPDVDAWFGTMELPLLLKKFNADYKHELLGERLTTTENHFAYLKVSEGCDRPCAFCAIPLMRGKHVSRPIEDLVKETKGLVKNGTKEILLIAQDSTYYGSDIYKKRNLSDLLKRLSDIDGLEWIRLHYAFPTGFPMDILEVMSERENICNYLDIPLQHASTKMLKLMRRGITREKTEALIQEVRNQVPDIAVRTTMIVGHPGEDAEDFQELTAFIDKMKFERLGVFAYSHEEKTHSYSMADDIPEQLKSKRAEALMTIQEEISHQLNQEKIGQSIKVLIDRLEGGYYYGRTEHDSPEVDNEVIIPAKDHFLRIGDFCNIKILNASAFDLHGYPQS